jgi:hypothetical protein
LLQLDTPTNTKQQELLAQALDPTWRPQKARHGRLCQWVETWVWANSAATPNTTAGTVLWSLPKYLVYVVRKMATFHYRAHLHKDREHSYKLCITLDSNDTLRPHVAFSLDLMADDMRPQLKTYGHDWMITPNLDALAASGLQFDFAYTQFACTPISFLRRSYHVPDAASVPAHLLLV